MMDDQAEQVNQMNERTSLLESEVPLSKKKNASEKTGSIFSRNKTDWLIVLCIAAVMVGLVSFLTIKISDNDNNQSTKLYSSSKDSFTASNHYGDFGNSYAFYGQYEMVEPHIDTTLTAVPTNDIISDDEEIVWEVETSNGVYEYLVGTEVVVTFTNIGKLSVKWYVVKTTTTSVSSTSSSTTDYGLTKHLSSWWNSNEDVSNSVKHDFKGFVGPKAPQFKTSSLSSSSSVDSYVWGIYVRRELRYLTDSDRDAFFDATEIVFRVPTKEGQALYGDKYYGAGFFGDKHNVLSGNSDCDHLHDGLGFFPSHFALTLMFEQTLQAINPRVTIPYWDYTIDMTNYELSGELSSFFGSVVFGEDYFGSAVTDQSKGDDDLVEDGVVDPSGRVLTGRFTQVEVSLDYWGMTSDVYNSYGHIRSPWNNNNDPYVNRFNSTYGFDAVGSARRRKLNEKGDLSEKHPGRKLEDQFGSVDCSTIYDVMQYDTWYDYGMNIEYEPHGPIHTLIGGTHGADYWSAISSRAKVDYDIVEYWGLLAFGLFKTMWRDELVTCPSSCSSDTPIADCKCTCVHIEEWTENATTAHAALLTINNHLFEQDVYTTDNDGNDISLIVLNCLCNNYEELNLVIGEDLQSSSPMEVSFWPTHPFIERLVHWKMIHSPFTDTAWGPDGVDVESSCYGHSRYDTVGWKNLWDADDVEYTNNEIIEKFNPVVSTIEDYGLSFIYDTFLWEHCTELGYPATLFDY